MIEQNQEILDEWIAVAEALYHAIHCGDDNHRIEAEQAYFDLAKRTKQHRA